MIKGEYKISGKMDKRNQRVTKVIIFQSQLTAAAANDDDNNSSAA
jgi:hypothetical protein